jgi:hypothetical protein
MWNQREIRSKAQKKEGEAGRGGRKRRKEEEEGRGRRKRRKEEEEGRGRRKRKNEEEEEDAALDSQQMHCSWCADEGAVHATSSSLCNARKYEQQSYETRTPDSSFVTFLHPPVPVINHRLIQYLHGPHAHIQHLHCLARFWFPAPDHPCPRLHRAAISGGRHGIPGRRCGS